MVSEPLNVLSTPKNPSIVSPETQTLESVATEAILRRAEFDWV